MAATANPTETTAATVNAQVASTLATVDTNAAQSVQTLGQVHQARLALQTRVAASAVAQYGSDSTQAKAAQATVAATKVTVARLALVHSQVIATAPPVAATGWAIYGHVFNSSLQPVSAYTVFLVDEQNAWQREYGFAYTNADGSFQINFQGPASASTKSQLFIEIVNDRALPVYLSTTPFIPKTGSATYQDITLASGEPILGDPPAEIRSIAIPKK